MGMISVLRGQGVRDVVLGIVLALGAASCGSDNDSDGRAATSFGPPKRSAGESWTTKSTTIRPTTPPETFSSEYTIYVDFAGERGAYSARSVTKGNPTTSQLTYNVDGNLVAANSCSFTPAVNTVQFPLEVGRTWKVDYTDCNNSHTTGTGEVVARETIPTALGNLDTLKIVIKSSATTSPSPIGDEPAAAPTTSTFTDTVNWSTQYGLWMKEHYESQSGPDEPLAITDTEITAFVPAK